MYGSESDLFKRTEMTRFYMDLLPVYWNGSILLCTMKELNIVREMMSVIWGGTIFYHMYLHTCVRKFQDRITVPYGTVWKFMKIFSVRFIVQCKLQDASTAIKCYIFKHVKLNFLWSAINKWMAWKLLPLWEQCYSIAAAAVLVILFLLHFLNSNVLFLKNKNYQIKIFDLRLLLCLSKLEWGSTKVSICQTNTIYLLLLDLNQTSIHTTSL